MAKGQGQNLAVPVLYAPNLLDSGPENSLESHCMVHTLWLEIAASRRCPVERTTAKEPFFGPEMSFETHWVLHRLPLDPLRPEMTYSTHHGQRNIYATFASHSRSERARIALCERCLWNESLCSAIRSPVSKKLTSWWASTSGALLKSRGGSCAQRVTVGGCVVVVERLITSS